MKRLRSYSPRAMLSNVMNPSSGRATCRTTSAMDTVRNLLYSGKYLKQKAVNAIKWLPTAIRTAIMVTAKSHHFSLPLYRPRPRMNRKIVMAPMYIGPAVKG